MVCEEGVSPRPAPPVLDFGRFGGLAPFRLAALASTPQAPQTLLVKTPYPSPFLVSTTGTATLFLRGV